MNDKIWSGVRDEVTEDYNDAKAAITSGSSDALVKMLNYLSKSGTYFDNIYDRNKIEDSIVRIAFDDMAIYHKMLIEVCSKMSLLCYFLNVDNNELPDDFVDMLTTVGNYLILDNRLTGNQKDTILDYIDSVKDDYFIFKRLLISVSEFSNSRAGTRSGIKTFLARTCIPSMILGVCAYSGVNDFAMYSNDPAAGAVSECRYTVEDIYKDYLEKIKDLMDNKYMACGV